MDSANDVRRAEARAAGILRLLMGLAAGAAMPHHAGGVMLVQQLIVDGDGDLFSAGVGGDGGVPPASKAAIASLKEVTAGGGDCAICLDAFDAGKEMPCGHPFHGECLERWLGVHGSCPVCRSELPKVADPAADGEQRDGGRRGPRGAVLLSYLVELPREEPQQREEEPWNIRIEDVD